VPQKNEGGVERGEEGTAKEVYGKD